MQVTLRKADTLQKELFEKVKELGPSDGFEITHDYGSDYPLDPVTNLSVYDKRPEKTLQEKRKRFENALQKRKKALDVVYKIRSLVGKTNEESSINQMLNELARLQQEIKFYEDIVGSPKRASDSELKKKIQNLSTKESKGVRVLEHVGTGLFTEEEIEVYREKLDELKREKNRLKDKLLEYNVHYKITLDKEDQDVLREFRILD